MAETLTSPNNAAVKFKGGPKVKKPRLPANTKKMAKRGLISPRQLAKMRGEG